MRTASSADEKHFRLHGADALEEKARVQLAERNNRGGRKGASGNGAGGERKTEVEGAAASGSRKRPREKEGAGGQKLSAPVCGGLALGWKII